MEVAPGIHRIETDFGGRTNAVYYLWGADRSLLVDTGTRYSAPEILAELQRLGAPSPHLVINTHSDWDHVAGNGIIRDAAPEAVFMAHIADQPLIEDVEVMITDRYGEFAPDHGFDESEESKSLIRTSTTSTTIDRPVTGGERLELGPDWVVSIAHTPGHSNGSISVVDERANTVIVGDAVLGAAVPFASGAPAFPPTYRYVDDYVSSVKALLELAPSLLLTSHYPIYRDGAACEFLYQSAEFVERTEAEFRQQLKGHPGQSLLEIATVIGPSLGEWAAAASAALIYPLTGHAERLAAAGLVDVSRTDGIARYRWRLV